MSKIPRRLLNDACVDDDQNALPIVSARDTIGGKATLATAVIIDGDDAFFDEAATHGRSPIERDIEWVSGQEEVSNARRIFVVWLFIRPDRVSREYMYHGAVAVDMYIDDETKRGYKRLGHHASQLGRSFQGDIDLDILDEAARAKLLEALQEHPDALEHSNASLKEALGLPV